jgi:hypothetical protein
MIFKKIKYYQLFEIDYVIHLLVLSILILNPLVLVINLNIKTFNSINHFSLRRTKTEALGQ